MSKCMLQCLLIFALQTLLMFCYVRFYFVFWVQAVCIGDARPLCYGVPSQIQWQQDMVKNETISWWISGSILLHLLIHLSLNLHLRFYTMVDYRLEQRLVLYNKLFIYLYKWLLPFDWMMNELNLSNITYLWYTSTRCHFDAKGIYCFGNECWDKRLIIYVFEWMNGVMSLFLYLYIQLYFLST